MEDHENLNVDNGNIPRWLHDFQLSLMDRFSSLERTQDVLVAGQKEIARRLAEQNGAISDAQALLAIHQEHFLKSQMDLVAHERDCPSIKAVVANVDRLHAEIASNREERARQLESVRMDLMNFNAERRAERVGKEARDAERARWFARIHPAIYVVVVLCVILTLEHAQDLLKA